VFSDVLYLTPLQHENRVGIHQRSETMRNDDERAAITDAIDIGVDDGFAIGIKRAGGLVEN
jgi:hypothetical protein